jgi:hypothetical protein
VDTRRIAAGGLSGALATVVMTGWMAVGRLTGPHGEPPPKRLVRVVSRRIGVPARRTSPGTLLASGVAHLAFGVGCGALYAALTRRSTTASGVAFGLAVWAVSYAGWIPALDLMPPPHRDRPHRMWTMVTAHVVYGAVLARALASAEGARR